MYIPSPLDGTEAVVSECSSEDCTVTFTTSSMAFSHEQTGKRFQTTSTKREILRELTSCYNSTIFIILQVITLSNSLRSCNVSDHDNY